MTLHGAAYAERRALLRAAGHVSRRGSITVFHFASSLDELQDELFATGAIERRASRRLHYATHRRALISMRSSCYDSRQARHGACYYVSRL